MSVLLVHARWENSESKYDQVDASGIDIDGFIKHAARVLGQNASFVKMYLLYPGNRDQ